MSRTPDEEKRKRILDAALEAFGKIGFKATTIKAIADTAQIAPGTIYTYFYDKDDLFFATLDKIWDTFNAEIDTAVQNKALAYQDRFMALFEKSMGLLRQSHSLLVGMFAHPERRVRLQKHLEAACHHLLPLFQDGRAQGYMDFPTDPDRGLYQIRILVSGALFDLSLVEGPELEAAVQRMAQAVKAEFLTPPARSRG